MSKNPKKKNGELDLRYKSNRIKISKEKKRSIPEIPRGESNFERLDFAKMKIPIQRKMSKKGNTYQTLYTDPKGRRMSKVDWYGQFKDKNGVPLTIDEVDMLITTTKAGTDSKDIFSVFENTLNNTNFFTDRKAYNTTVEYSMIDAFLLDKLQTHRSVLKGLPLQMGYLSTLKNDAIEEIENRFKSQISILGVAFDLEFKNSKKKVDTAILGDSVRVRIYGKNRTVNKLDKVGEYIYSASTGKVKKSDISDWWD